MLTNKLWNYNFGLTLLKGMVMGTQNCSSNLFAFKLPNAVGVTAFFILHSYDYNTVYYTAYCLLQLYSFNNVKNMLYNY